MNDEFKAQNAPAFPCEWDYINSNRAVANGMSLRDYFAAKAMVAIMAPNPVTGQYPQADEFAACAEGAYLMADAMLKAREA